MLRDVNYLMISLLIRLYNVKSNLPIAQQTIPEDENESYAFSFASLHSTTLFYHLPTSSSCSVVEALSSNIDKGIILHMVCGDFNAHNTEWLCHSHTTDVAGLFCQEFAMAQDPDC